MLTHAVYDLDVASGCGGTRGLWSGRTVGDPGDKVEHPQTVIEESRVDEPTTRGTADNEAALPKSQRWQKLR